MNTPRADSVAIDSPEHRLKLQELVSVHYLGCDIGDLEMATGMMLRDVRFTLPPFGLVFTNREQTKGGLADVITKLPRQFRHRPAGFRFATPDRETLRAYFTTSIVSCLNGRVHAIGDIKVDTVMGEGELVVSAWEVSPIYFRGLISGGTLARLPRFLLTVVPFLLPSDVRKLFVAARS